MARRTLKARLLGGLARWLERWADFVDRQAELWAALAARSRAAATAGAGPDAPRDSVSEELETELPGPPAHWLERLRQAGQPLEWVEGRAPRSGPRRGQPRPNQAGAAPSTPPDRHPETEAKTEAASPPGGEAGAAASTVRSPARSVSAPTKPMRLVPRPVRQAHNASVDARPTDDHSVDVDAADAAPEDADGAQPPPAPPRRSPTLIRDTRAEVEAPAASGAERGPQPDAAADEEPTDRQSPLRPSVPEAHPARRPPQAQSRWPALPRRREQEPGETTETEGEAEPRPIRVVAVEPTAPPSHRPAHRRDRAVDEDTAQPPRRPEEPQYDAWAPISGPSSRWVPAEPAFTDESDRGSSAQAAPPQQPSDARPRRGVPAPRWAPPTHEERWPALPEDARLSEGDDVPPEEQVNRQLRARQRRRRLNEEQRGNPWSASPF